MFKGEYVIKTVEKEIDIKQTQESIPLISRQLIAEHIKDYGSIYIYYFIFLLFSDVLLNLIP